MLVPTIADVQKKVTPVLIEFGVRKAVLFGSIVKGTATEDSDVDLLVDSGLHGFDFIDLGESVRMSMDRPVDIFDVTHIRKGSRVEQEILRTGCCQKVRQYSTGENYAEFLDDIMLQDACIPLLLLPEPA